MALRQLGLFQLNTNPGNQEIDFGTASYPLDEIFASSISATTIIGDGSGLKIDALDSLVESLSVETSAREGADVSLATKISTDVGVAIENLVNGAPSALDTLVELAAKIGEGTISEANIVAEINSVGVRVTNEEAARLEGDNSLATVLGQLSTGLSSQLASEIASTDGEITALTSRVSTEESVRAQQVVSLQNEITGEVNADIDSVDARVLGAEGDIVSVEERLSTEEVNREDAVVSLQGVVTSEVNSIDIAMADEASFRTDGDISLATVISTETSTRVDEMVALESDLSDEAAVRAIADNSLDSRVDALEANAYDDSSLNTRVATAEADASSLETRVSSEEVVRLSKDNSLATLVGQNTTNLNNASGSLTSRVSSEEVVRANADSSLNTKIESESAARVVGDNSLDAKIESEVSTLVDSIGVVDQELSDEAALRVAGDVSLHGKIDIEVSILEDADSALTSRIASEESFRASQDAALSNEISAQASMRLSADVSMVNSLQTADLALEDSIESVETKLGVETSERISEDSSLSSRIDAIELASAGDFTSIDDRVLDVEGDVASVDVRLSATDVEIADLDSKIDSEISSEVVARNSAITEAVDELLGGAGEAYDTLKELQTELEGNDTDIATILTNQSSINDRVSSEEALRASQDTVLDNKIDGEIADRVAAEGSLHTVSLNLQVDINNEIANREDADDSLETRISQEESVRLASINSLETAAYNDSSINTRVSNVEDLLDSEIESEASSRVLGDSSLNTKIGSVSTALASEIATTGSEVISLSSRIADEEGVRGNAVSSLQAKDVSLHARISSETVARVNADSSLHTKAVNIEGDITSLDSRVLAEESTRLAKDNSLASSVGSVDTRIAAEEAKSLSLNVRVSNVEENVTSEVGSIDTRLGNIEADAYDDTSINTRMGDEESARAAGDTSLDTKIGSEASSRVAGDASLNTKIGTVSTALASEIASTNNDVNTLTSRISSEEVARANADSSMNTVIGGVSADLDTEGSARAAADLSLTNRIAGEEAVRLSVDASLEAAINVNANDIASHNELTGASISGDILTVSGSLSNYTVNLSQFNDNTDNFVNGASLVGDVLTLTRESGLDLTINLGQYQTSSEVNAAIVSGLDGYATESYVDSAVAPKADTVYVDQADASLEAAISAVQSDFDSLPEDENDFVTSAAMDGNVLELTRNDGGVVSVDLSQFMDDTDTDNFVSGASLSGDVLTLARTNGNISVNLGQYQTSSEVASQITSAIAGYATEAWVTGRGFATTSQLSSEETARVSADESLEARLSASEEEAASHNELDGASFAGNVLTVSGSQQSYTVNLSALATDVKVSSGSYDSATGELTLTKTDGGTVVVSDFYVDVDGDNFITSATLSGQSLVLGRQGLSNLTVDLSGFVTSGELTSAIANFKTGGQITSEIATAIAPKANTSYVDASDASLAVAISAVQSDFDSLPEDENDFVNSATLSGNVLTLGRTDGGSVSVDLSQFMDDTDTDNFLTGASLTGDVLTLTKTNGNVSVNLGQYQTSSEVASQIASAIAGYATEAWVTGRGYATTGYVNSADTSLTTRIASLEGALDAESSSRVEDEDYVVSAAMSNDTLKLTRAQGGVVTVDLSQFKDNTDNYLTGVSLTGDVLSLSRVSGGSVSVNLGKYQTSSEVASQITSAIAGYATESYVDTADAQLLSKINSVDTRFGGLPNEDYVTSAALSNQTLKLTRAQGGVVSVDLGTFTTSGELSSALLPYAKGTNVATDISNAVAVEASNRVVKDNSLNTRINGVSTAVGTEASTRLVKDNSLHTRVNLVSNEVGLVKSLTDQVSVVNGDVSLQVENLITNAYDDSSLETRIINEESTRLSKDSSLHTRIGSVSTAIANEISATNGDITSLNTRVGNEEGTRASKDSSLATAISIEAAARAAGDANLGGRIDDINELAGVTYASGSKVLTVQGSESNFSVNLSSLATDVTVTGGTYTSASQTLTLTKNNGDTIDVSGFAIDTDNDNYVDSVAFNTSNGVLTLGRSGSLSDLTVDLDGRYLVDSKDTYTTGATFNTGNGIVTFTNNDGGTYSVDLDGRFTDNGYADALNQHLRTTDSPTFAKINTGKGATEVHLMNQNVRTSDGVTFASVAASLATIGQRIVVGSTTVDGAAGILQINTDVEITGELRALSKSFLIDHPTQPNMKLQYGNLEGPEHGVYVRGKVGADGVIELPEYWTELVDEDSITVQLTAIGSANTHFVESIEDNKVKVGSESGEVNAFYMVNAERKDIYKLKVEFPA